LKLTYKDVKTRLYWSESNDLEFKPDFKDKNWQYDRIFDTIVAMANNEGGNIIIGINESPSKHTRYLTGTNYDAIQLGDKLHQLIYEYVDHTDLSLDVYVIEDKGKNNPKLIGIEIKSKAKRFYAKRYHGRSTTKSTSYTLLLRVNGLQQTF
jgi:predicted HTH transcriptional regulator